jgi:ribonuclease-3
MTALEERIGHRFQQPALLDEALTHPSVAHEARQTRLASNQRLEFLGDAVLQMLATEFLWNRLAREDEGTLTRRRALLVSRDAMTALARALHLGTALRLGKVEDRAGGRTRPSALADAMEAVIGAIYEDGDWPAARAFALRVLHPFWNRHELTALQDANPKGRLQELLQRDGGEAPVYETADATGPDHAPEFHVRVLWRGDVLGDGSGASKKEAESRAAAAALARIESRHESNH